jgi:hypothetical protein
MSGSGPVLNAIKIMMSNTDWWKEVDEMEKNEIDDLRKVMGTDPSRDMERQDNIVVGCRGIEVKLIDGPIDPYRAIVEGAVATWGESSLGGDWGGKYDRLSDEGKLMVLLSCLSHKTLPIALEGPKFVFEIHGPSRAAFDQIARARIGAGFNSIGTRDNAWLRSTLRIPHEVANDPEQFEAHKKAWISAKDAYEITVKKKREAWQAGRFVLPMGVCHNFVANFNYLALQGFMANRLKFCEQADCVGTAWLMRKAVAEKYPLLGAFLRPGCDFANRCQYHQTYNLSDLFGALFKSCGRHKVEDGHHAEFNCACSNQREIEEDLHIEIPKPDHWNYIVRSAIVKDKQFENSMSLEKVNEICNQIGV